MEFLTWSFPLALLRNSSTASTACWNRFPLLIFIISSLCAWYGFSCSTLIQALAENTHRKGMIHTAYARYQRPHPSRMQWKYHLLSLDFETGLPFFQNILLTTSSSWAGKYVFLEQVKQKKNQNILQMKSLCHMLFLPLFTFLLHSTTHTMTLALRTEETCSCSPIFTTQYRWPHMDPGKSGHLEASPPATT